MPCTTKAGSKLQAFDQYFSELEKDTQSSYDQDRETIVENYSQELKVEESHLESK